MTDTIHRNVYMTDELQAIYEQTVAFVAKEVTPHGDAWEAAGKVPRETLRAMGELGMLSLRVPQEHGGLGLGMLASATFSEALGSSTLRRLRRHGAGAHRHGRAASRQLGVARAARRSGCRACSPARRSSPIGVTEPDAGSDVAGIRSTAVKDGDGWRINGTKMFITNGVHGDLTIVAAETDPQNKYGITMFLVPAGTEGFTVGTKLAQARLAVLATPPNSCSTTSGCPTPRSSAPSTAASTRR